MAHSLGMGCAAGEGLPKQPCACALKWDSTGARMTPCTAPTGEREMRVKSVHKKGGRYRGSRGGGAPCKTLCCGGWDWQKR